MKSDSATSHASDGMYQVLVEWDGEGGQPVMSVEDFDTLLVIPPSDESKGANEKAGSGTDTKGKKRAKGSRAWEATDDSEVDYSDEILKPVDTPEGPVSDEESNKLKSDLDAFLRCVGLHHLFTILFPEGFTRPFLIQSLKNTRDAQWLRQNLLELGVARAEIQMLFNHLGSNLHQAPIITGTDNTRGFPAPTQGTGLPAD